MDEKENQILGLSDKVEYLESVIQQLNGSVAEKEMAINKLQQEKVAEITQLTQQHAKLEQMRDQNLQTAMAESIR